MIVLDSSAVVALLEQEPGHRQVATWLEESGRTLISAPTRLELTIVAESRRPGTTDVVRRLLTELSVEVVPFGDRLAERAIDAWRRFGKGRHPARLNFGDCCTYALAAETGHPILCCTGEDFVLTDLPVLRPDQAPLR